MHQKLPRYTGITVLLWRITRMSVETEDDVGASLSVSRDDELNSAQCSLDLLSFL